MASWSLGQMFIADEDAVEDAFVKDDNVTGEEDSGDKSGSDSEDEDAAERAAAFKNNKRISSARPLDADVATTASNRSIRRYDEYGNFISRSERARAEKQDQQPEVDEGRRGSMKTGDGKSKDRLGRKKRIHFKPEQELEDTKEIPFMDDDDKSRCFMGRANWYVKKHR